MSASGRWLREIVWVRDGDVYCGTHAPPDADPVLGGEAEWAERQVCGVCGCGLGSVDAGREHPAALPAGAWPSVRTVSGGVR